MDSPIDDYISSHIDAEPENLRRLYRDTHLYQLYPRMCSGHVQGRILTMLTRMIAPVNILELGTFTGYSALCFAEGMPNGSQLWSVEIDDEMEDLIIEHFSQSPRGKGFPAVVCQKAGIANHLRRNSLLAAVAESLQILADHMLQNRFPHRPRIAANRRTDQQQINRRAESNQSIGGDRSGIVQEHRGAHGQQTQEVAQAQQDDPCSPPPQRFHGFPHVLNLGPVPACPAGMVVDGLVGHKGPLLARCYGKAALYAHLRHLDDGLPGLGGAVGTDDDVGAVEDFIIGMSRLVPKHVEPRPGDAPAFQGGAQIRLVDEFTPAAVDENGGGLHGVQLRFGDGVVGDTFNEGHLDNDYVGGPKGLKLVFILLHAQLRHLLPAEEGVIADDLHVQAQAQMRDDSANGAQADDEAGFFFHLKDLLGVPNLPVALALLHIAFHHILGEGQHQGYGVFGHAAVVGPRRDDHGDAQSRGGFHVHAVISNAGPADDLQRRAGFHSFPVNSSLVRHPDDKGVGVLQLVQVMVGMGVVCHENFGLSVQKGHALLTDGFRHGNFHRLVPLFVRLALTSLSWRWPCGCHSPWRSPG